MGRRSTTKPVDEKVVVEQPNSDNTIDVLMKQIQELQKQLELMKEQQKNQPVIVEQKQEKDIRIDGREYIKVMSLSNIPLNLSTEPRGGGRLFQFAKFGEVIRIMYDDLVKIIYNHRNFLQQGRFYIMNPDIVRLHGYEDDYLNILTKEKIEAVLNNGKNALDFYKSANDTQKNIIHEILIRKVRDDLTSVDTNLIVAIKQISEVDIIAEAEKIKKSVLSGQLA